MIFITLSEDDQILGNINNEDDEENNTCDKYEVQKDVENCVKSIKTGLMIFKKFIQFPVVLYFYFVQCTTNFDFEEKNYIQNRLV